MARAKIIAGKAVIVIEAQDLLDKSLGMIKNKMHRFANTLSSLGDKAFRVGFFGGIGSAGILRQFAKFEDAILELQTKIQSFGKNAALNEREIKALDNTIRNIAKSTTFTASEVTKAAVELAKAGLSIEKIQRGLLPVLDLARGSGLAMNEAATAYARISTVFGKSGNELASLLVRTTREGTLNILDLAESIKFSSATARALNVEFETLLATFSSLADQGLVGSIAGTSLNTGLANLVKKEEEIRALGASLVFTNDGALDLAKTIMSLRAATQNMNGPELVRTFQGLFNLRGARAMVALTRGGFSEFMKDLQNLRNTGAGEASAARLTREQGLTGRTLLLVSALQDLAITIGEITKGPMANFIMGIRQLTLALTTLVKTTAGQKAALAVIFAPAGLLAAGAAMIVMSNAVRMLAFSLGGLQTVLRSVGGVFARTLGSIARGVGIMHGINVSGGVASGIAGARGGMVRAGQHAALIRGRIRQARAAAIAQKAAIGKESIERMRVFRTNNMYDKRRAVERARQAGNLGTNLGRTKGLRSMQAMRSTMTAASAGASALARGLSTAFGAARRLFSLSGVGTVLELIVLFNWERFGAAFSGAFKQLGAIFSNLSGPLKLFWTSIQLLAQGNAQQGIQGLTLAFQGLVQIIGNQLVAAWNAFKEGLGPVWDFFANLGKLLTHIFNLMMQLGNTVGGAFGQLSDASGLSNLMEGGGGVWGAVNMLIKGIAFLATYLTGFIDDLIIAFQMLITQFQIMLKDTFVAGIGTAILDRQLEALEQQMGGNKLRRERDLLRFNKSVDAQDAATEGGQNKRRRRGMTEGMNRWLREQAEIAKRILANTPKNPMSPPPGAEAAARPLMRQQRNMMQSAIRSGGFVKALVGSVAQTQNNLRQVTPKIEQQQLEELQKQTALMETGGGGLKLA